MDIRFLALADLIAIHSYQIEHFGGADGVRDWHLLQSAIAMPAVSVSGQYLHADVLEMAAAYLFHLVQNHPFVDGNKRVGAAAAAVFLEFNDLRLTAAPDEYADLVVSVARGEAGKSTIAGFFRDNVKQA